MSKKIFISYRRSDTQMTAGRLYDALVRYFGKPGVFRDKEAIRPGRDFVEEIQRALTEDVVVLALIGPQWTTSHDASGRRRLEDPHDSNRLELEAALANNVALIPVLVEGASMPRADELPSSLEALTRRNAVRLRDDDWDSDFTRLAEAVAFNGVEPSADSVKRSDGRQKRRARAVAGVLGIALVAVLVLLLAFGLPPFSKPDVPSVAGEWMVVQTTDVRHVGTLFLIQDGMTLSGTMKWENLSPAAITSGEVSGHSIRFVLQYPGEVEGLYEGTLNESLNRIEGTSVGQGRSATWRADRR